jgi:hypothetical protein
MPFVDEGLTSNRESVAAPCDLARIPPAGKNTAQMIREP